jgi:multimeric flavodoxin WrbA
MQASQRFLGLVGSYRKGGVIDTVVTAVLDSAAARGAETKKIYLSDQRVEFCTNCRECVQPEGLDRVPCVVHTGDDVNSIFNDIEASGTLVLGAPVNLGAANALTQRFAERCIGNYYYPWGRHYPVLRNKQKVRNAIIVSSSAAPRFMNSGVFGSGALRTLETMADLMGAEIVETIKVGLVSEREYHVPEKTLRHARQVAEALAA